MVWPPYEPQKYSDVGIPEDVAAAWAALLDDILGIESIIDHDGNPQPHYLGVSTDAKAAFVAWHDQLAEDLVNAPDDDVRAAWGKLKGVCLRIALAFTCADGVAQGQIKSVDVGTMRRAIAVTTWFQDESARLYADICVESEDDDKRDGRRLAEWIRGRGGALTVRDVQQYGPMRFRRSADVVTGLLVALSPQSCNHHLRAAKQFSRWLWRDGRAKTDPRHQRRALEPAEVARLLPTAEHGPAVAGLAGHVRATLYRLVLGTGFRANECRTLVPEVFNLDTQPPTVTMRAARVRRDTGSNGPDDTPRPGDGPCGVD